MGEATLQLVYLEKKAFSSEWKSLRVEPASGEPEGFFHDSPACMGASFLGPTWSQKSC